MSFTKQDLFSVKKENLKFKKNFDKFMQKHEANNKMFISKREVKKFMEEQKTLMDTINHRVDEMIAAKDRDEKQQHHTVASGALSQKRRRSEIARMTTKESKRSHKEPVRVNNYFENIIKNPGLQHMAENIFSNLNYNDIKACHLINRSSKTILDNPKFWLKKFIQKSTFSKQNEIDWNKAIQLVKNTNYEKNIALYLKKSLMKGNVTDIPCFVDETFLKNCQGRSLRYLKQFYLSSFITEDNKAGCIQLLAQFSNCYGKYELKDEIDDEMCIAASRGYLKIIKALIPLIDNLKMHYCNYNYCKYPLMNHLNHSNNCYIPTHVKNYFDSINPQT